MSIEEAHSGATVTFSQRGTCGGIFCVKVTLFVGERCFIQMPQKKKPVPCCTCILSCMYACTVSACLWLFVHLCMLNAPCLTISTLRYAHFDLTYASPFSPPPPRCINQIPCSTSACVIPSPEGETSRNLTSTHPPPERSIQIIIGMKLTEGSLPSFTFFFFFCVTFFSPQEV